MQGLGDAAVCRSESDWLVGINGTRAMTAFNSKTGGFHLTTVGRVQTPTLAIVVEREKKIREFKPRSYWEVEAEFAAKAGAYTGKWFDEGYKGKEDDEHARADRLWEKARPTPSVPPPSASPASSARKAKPETRLSPLLFDLTSLQREANARFGFSAKTTLSLAQALYEKHKVLTYPRTDSRCLPEDYLATVKETLSVLTGEGAGKGHDEVLLARYSPVRPPDPGPQLGIAEQAHLQQRQDQRPLRHHPDAAGAQAPERTRTEALRLRRPPLPLGLLPGRRIPGDHPHHPRRRPSLQDRGQGAGQSGLAGRARQGRPGRRRRQSGCGRRQGKGQEPRKSPSRPTKPSRRRATRKPPCSPPWKAPARWSTTRN
jgi:hypothetical protein